jgi:modulator of drug activity B
MKNVLIINAHEINQELQESINNTFIKTSINYFMKTDTNVIVVNMEDNLTLENQVSLFKWADTILFQLPVNWMSVPEKFKKYLDTTLNKGIKRALKEYKGSKKITYMLSLSFTSPSEAFGIKKNNYLIERMADNIVSQIHFDFSSLRMTKLQTFVSLNSLKTPEIKNDKNRFIKHLEEVFPNNEEEMISVNKKYLNHELI